MIRKILLFVLLSIYTYATTLNIKYNNAGNIKLQKKNEWRGQTNTNSNDTFAKFSTPELGIRALRIVIEKNISRTDSYITYVNRYASEEYEREHLKETGKLRQHLHNYAVLLAKSQNDVNISKRPTDINMLNWIKATIVAESGKEALNYYTDEIIKEGIKEE